MIHHKIESENPNHHWSYLKVENEKVLDLGCGKHFIDPGWLTTPEYFLSKGANFVIGIDSEGNDINWFNENIKNGYFITDTIDSIEKLDKYINENQITSLKMDIEGAEIHFINSNEQYSSLKHIAVETHSRALFHDMLIKLIKLNFEIEVICTFYPRVYDICNLIFASRKNNN